LVSAFLAVSEYLVKFPDDVEAKEFRDPLIVQFPTTVSNVSGTFGGATSGALAIQSGLTCVNTVPGEQLCAEAGHQLVVLDLPPGTPNGAYSLALNFTVTPPAPITVKAVFTGRVVIAGQTFYPVLVPCVTSFASAPSVTIPLSSTLVGIPLPTAGVTACTGRTIDFRQVAAQAIPTLSEWAALALAMTMAGFALYALRGRRQGA
jgi:hypothetical protein